MDERGQFATSHILESLNGWWQLAGVDCAVGDEAVDWLNLDIRPDIPAPVAPPKTAMPMPVAIHAQIEWPRDIASLRMMIAGGDALPGNAFSKRPVAPAGPDQADIMVISDRPDDDELASSMLGSGATGILLTRMLAAIGIRLDQCYWTALATTIPAAGDVPENALADLASFARFQIGLVQPKSIILLGSSACKALLDEDMMKARRDLRVFNHNDRNMAVLTTFHPRTLIARPQMKGQAWKDLQMFAKRDVL
jgi:uracil-DNA glycosylase